MRSLSSNPMFVVLVAAIAAAGTAAAGDPFLYAGDSFSGTLYTIDTNTEDPARQLDLLTTRIRGMLDDDRTICNNH